MLKKEFINPHPMGFTNAVTYTINGVKTIQIAGQVGYADGAVPEDFAEQADIAYANLVRELNAAGAKIEDVVKINTYIVDLDRAKTSAIRDAKEKHFTQKNQPASTIVGVSALVFPNLKVEIEATAVVEA